MVTIEIAALLADTASEIDHRKNMAPECERAILAQIAEDLHDKAQKLAGDRVNEIYCQEELHA